MDIKGYWFEVGSSTRVKATLVCKDNAYQLVLSASETSRSGPLTDLEISDRVGNIARKLYWPDESLFETVDNNAVDQIQAQSHKHNRSSSVLHKMESSTVFALVALVVTVLSGILFFKYGLPTAAKHISASLPVSATTKISEGALKNMDRFFFEESKLSEETQARWQAQFDKTVALVPNQGFEFKLHFREMGLPNAMALPGGDIIVTDQFIELIDEPGEFDAVLLHEIAHVVERHGLEQVVQASAISIIIGLAIGDVSGIGEIITSMSVFLIKSSYSRDAETRADEYAFKKMMELGIDPAYFADIILKLGVPESITREASEDDDTKDEQGISDYLSTHPATQDRASRALELSNEFNNN